MEIPGILFTKQILQKRDDVLGILPNHFRVKYYEDIAADSTRHEYEDIQGILMAPIYDMFGYIRDESFISLFPNLKIVATPSTGYDHIDIKMLNRRGIKVSNIPGDKHNISDATAEFGFGLMLTLARNIHTGMCAYLQEDYNWLTYLMMNSGSLLFDSTLGIVGMGQIGYKIAERAAAFKMNIVYHNRTRRSKDDEERVNATYCQTIDDLLRISDHVMLTVPLIEDTKSLIGAREFKLMKPSAAIINIARGAVIDQDALIEALKNKTIQGAALDVTTPEPLPPDHPLLKMTNVIVTPHTAGCSIATFHSNYKICVDDIKAAIDERPVPNEVIL